MSGEVRSRNICIYAAMREEIEPLSNRYKREKWNIQGEGVDMPHLVYLGSCGVGKVNAAIKTTKMIIRHEPIDLFILIGTAAAIDPALKIGDIVIASDVVQHDVDVTALGFKLGEVPFAQKSEWAAQAEDIEVAVRAAQKIGLKPQVGRFLTGDRFVADPGQAQALRQKLGGIAIEMEGAAFAQACTRCGVSWLIVKVISDTADKSSPVNFNEFLPQAAQLACDLVVEILHSLPAGVKVRPVGIPSY